MEYLITGSGYLAKNLIKKLLENDKITKIKVYSRPEKDQWELKTYFNNPKLEFIIGDVRDYQATKQALAGVDVCIHTGAIKRIEVAERQPMEAIKTNVLGSMNVINSCVENKVKKLILISTDKATSATTCYGSTKFLMECMAYANQSETDIICCRYGNVFGSTGSIIPIFENLVKQNKPLTIRNPEMTRLFQPVDVSINLILDMIKYGKNGELWVYESKSATIQQIADIFSDNQIITGVESIEKTDEALLTVSELNHSKRFGDYYIVRKDYESEVKYETPLTSDTAERLSQDTLKNMLEDWRSLNV